MIIYLQDKDGIGIPTIQAFLASLGFTVVRFRDFPVLRELLKEYGRGGGAVIADFNLSRMGITNLLRPLHREYPQVPVILLTGDGTILPTPEAVACGVFGFLHQPLHLAELELMLYRMGRVPLPNGPAATLSPPLSVGIAHAAQA